MARSKIKYLSNKELLREINESKKTYCYFIDDQYSNFDIIVSSIDFLDDQETIEKGKFLRAKRLTEDYIRSLLLSGENPKNYDTNIEPESIKLEDVVFRVKTYEHIPHDFERKKNPKTEADVRVKVPFEPFKHYIIRDNEKVEVGRSHWVNGLQNGHFDLEHGYITRRLANMFIKLVSRYSTKPNWRGYSYLEDMKSQALLQLSFAGLKFDESRSDNPFAFFTQIIKNCFRGTIIDEKKKQDLRDELLMAAGSAPSHTKQIEHEMAMRAEEAKEETKI